MNKNLISFFAVTIMLLFASSVQAQFSGGSGTAQDPYKISTAEDLDAVRSFVGASHTDKYFRMINDIDLTAYLSGNAEGWLPIGDETNKFMAHFSGGGYAVKGLHVDRDFIYLYDGTTYVVGLFGYNTGTIEDLGVEGSKIQGTSNLLGEVHVGGLVGHNTGIIRYCYATIDSVSISPHKAYNSLGGLVGYNNGVISNCYVTGSSVYPLSDTSSHTQHLGGLVGYLQNGSVINCYSAIGVTGSDPFVGAIIGYTYGGTISHLYYNLDITGTLAGIGVVSGGTQTINILGLTTAGMKVKGAFVDWNFDTIWDIQEGITYPFLQGSVPKNVKIISGNKSVCPNTTHTYGVESGHTDYLWSVTNGVIMSGQSTYQVDVKWDSGVTSGKISITYSDGVSSKGVTIYGVAPTPPSIAGNFKPLAGDTATYTTENGMSDYIWNVTGGTIQSGQGSNKIKVKWDCVLGEGHITVNYTNNSGGNCYPPTIPTDSIVTKQANSLPTVLGDVQTPAGKVGNYTTEQNMSDYMWTVNGGTIQSGQGTYHISVLWYCVPSGSVSVNYTNAKGCQAVAPTEKSVALQGIARPTITGTMQSYIGQTVSYSTEENMNNYVWTATNGTVKSGQGTHSVSIQWDNLSSDGIGRVAVNYANPTSGCSGAVPADSAVVLKVPSSDATLSDLTVTVGALSPIFSSDNINYVVNVANNVTTVTLIATKNSALATVTGDGIKALQTGSNTFEIVVTAEDGVTQTTYTVVVLRAYSTDASLSLITVDAGTLTPTFSSTTYSYTVNVASTISTVTLSVLKGNAAATVVGDGQQVLDIGLNTFCIIVTAEDGSAEQTYTVAVTRASNVCNEVVDDEEYSQIYPNPTTGIINIESTEIPNVLVYTQDGRLLLRTNSKTIDLSPYPAGIYFLDVDGMRHKVVKK
ncbi:MAG: cadherin-like beta sandwich domain-containing protein [Bacteroidales bacterium]|jgi:hypothetical protein|nr:cadherin-like beta sandwich domain-containing protein [Bacteroidales bacterium]